MYGKESATGPIEESAVATVAEWPEGLAALLRGAVDQARAAVVEFSGPDAVGDYLGVSFEDPTAATHRFLAHLPGYTGWQWAAVVAAYPGADQVTISEVVLVPGPTSLLAPDWVPWDQRVRQGDLSPGDLLPPAANDERLVPGFTSSGDPQVDETAAEVGLGRRWVMGLWGRADAAERWHTGDYGPDSTMARSTKRLCRDCGFFLPLAGSLGAMFGVCGNELSADGHIVDKQYGCGAHSDTPAPAGSGSPMYEPYDDGVLDVMVAPEPPESPVVVADQPEESPEASAEPAQQPAAEPEVVAESPEAAAESLEKPAEPAEAVAASPEAATDSAEAATDSPD
ncbi:hypothetical protein ATCCBAA256_04750 [Mycobacterium montefiorense]|nr:DUF3027 domain-containing protein [Mycobacterium montefiorense]GLE50889.1 hypothetical protein ATCCBAA256_04750 [Mycobacterium montefiorense]